MSTRSTLPFLIMVFIVALAGTFLALTFFNSRQAPRETVRMVTVEILVTATVDPNASPMVTIVTATTDRTQVTVPTELLGAASTAPAVSTRPTLDVAGAQQLNPDVAQTATALPANCQLHTIVEGDAPFAIAEQYGANPFLLLEANGLTEETATGLQIGDTLIVPLDGCPVEDLPSYQPAAEEGEPTFTPAATEDATEESTQEATPAQSVTPKPSPTITLAPTAQNAEITIVAVEKMGDVTAEGISLRNEGAIVSSMDGWTLSDVEGNIYTFNAQDVFFSGAEIKIFTRDGTDTPVVRYWGLDRPVWNTGDVITLKDNKGAVIATRRVDDVRVP
jgi:hypothetical protein